MVPKAVRGGGDDIVENRSTIVQLADLFLQLQALGGEILDQTRRGRVGRATVHITHARQQFCDALTPQAGCEQFLDVDHPVDGGVTVLALPVGSSVRDQ